MKKFFTIIIFIFISSFIFSQTNLEKSIVKIITINNAPDYNQPWQMAGQSSVSGSGSIISKNRILTNAHIVSNSTFIQVSKSNEPVRYVAKLIAVDHECDLALLTVDDDDFFKDVTPLELGECPSPGDTVKVYGFPIGGDKLSLTKGIVSRIEMTQYSHSLRTFLTIQIDAAVNPGNSGGPVIKDNKIIGVAFESMDKSQNIGYAIPTFIINHFLNDLKDNKYSGFPSLGIITQNLESDAYRKKLSMKENQTGIVVQDIEYGGSAYGILQKEDVILSIDGIKIANDGTIPFEKDSRVDFAYLIDSKYSGDTINMEILRDKKLVKLDLKLKNYTPIIPRVQYDVKPTYYIFGGLVFIPLTVNYIYSLWSSGGRPSLLDRIIYDVATPERKQIIVLQQVLADETNKGYHDFTNLIVKKVNKMPVVDIKDLIEKIENSDEQFLEIELENSFKIVLEIEKSKNASLNILKKYGIKSDRSEDLQIDQTNNF
jgi:S1-C subfamily serine protease